MHTQVFAHIYSIFVAFYEKTRKKTSSTPGFEPTTSRLVANCANHYTMGAICKIRQIVY